MPKKVNLMNQTFGRLLVIEETNMRWNKQVVWKCLCICGRECYVRSYNLQSNTKSCGQCGLQKETAINTHTKHGHSRAGNRTPTYYSWSAMRYRVFNPHHQDYHRYGGRGIKVCDRWLGNNGFKNFYSDMGERPTGLTIDRINNDGNYTPDNCRWATRKEQSQNSSVTKLNGDKVKKIKVLLNNNKFTQQNIADMYKVSDVVINKINLGKMWGDY